MIRPATLDDAVGLRAAVIAAYAPFVAKGIGLPPFVDGLDDDIRDHHVWVAEDRGLIFGGIVLVMNGKQAHIANLAVHPMGEGQGLGRRLIDTANAAALTAGCTQTDLTTHKDMTETQAFYARLGWVETGCDGDKVTFALDLH